MPCGWVAAYLGDEAPEVARCADEVSFNLQPSRVKRFSFTKLKCLSVDCLISVGRREIYTWDQDSGKTDGPFGWIPNPEMGEM